MYDFRGSNSIAWKICEIPANAHCTRRWAVIVKRNGDVVKIVSAIESHTLSNVDANEIRYSNAIEWKRAVEDSLKDSSCIAMEYSENCALPVVSKVDAGTIEWIRSLNKWVVSSADIAQHFQAVWTQQQLNENVVTASKVRSAIMDAMNFLGEKLNRNQHVTEFDVQQHIMRYFGENDLTTDNEPIVAIAKNASSPHYSPTPEKNSVITKDNLVLIDMWAKAKNTWSTYADITWMCYTGSAIPKREKEIFTSVRDARNAALTLVRERFSEGKVLRGFEVDDAARSVIDNAGYGQFFIHRTGHNIGEETHGAGANMDNYETHDTREVLAGTSFSIEPGIYIPNEIGVRSEISVIIDFSGNVLVPSNPMQEEIIRLYND